MGKVVVSAFLSLMITAASALGHEQKAVVGGKRIQPTPKSVEQNLKEHKALQEKSTQGSSTQIPSTATQGRPKIDRSEQPK